MTCLSFHLKCYKSHRKRCRSKTALLWKYARMCNIYIPLDSLHTGTLTHFRLSAVSGWFKLEARVTRGVEPIVSRAQDARSHPALSTMLETKFLSAQWILPTKPAPREVQNNIFLQLAPTNFSLLPSGLLECLASVITLLSSYSTVNSRGCGRPPIYYWST